MKRQREMQQMKGHSKCSIRSIRPKNEEEIGSLPEKEWQSNDSKDYPKS